MSKAPEPVDSEAFTVILIGVYHGVATAYCRLEYAIAMLTISLMLNS